LEIETKEKTKKETLIHIHCLDLECAFRSSDF